MTIEVFRPDSDPADYAALADCLASGWLGTGPRVAAFESAWAEHVSVGPEAHVIALTCATEALYQVCEWLAVERVQDEVILPANAFIGAANAVRAAGLKPVLVDVDPRTLNPTSDGIWAAMTDRTSAVIVQHFGGVPVAGLSELAARCRQKGIALVEDCACAPASTLHGIPLGAWGDFGIWSFDAMKIMTTGDGGMLYCREERAAADIRREVRLGQSEPTGQGSENPRWWEFTVEYPGRRAAMNDLAAALGLSQLRRLPDLVSRRQLLWTTYQWNLSDLKWLTLPPEPPKAARSSYYCYWVQCEARDALAAWLRAHDIYTTYRYWPVHRAYGEPRADLPNTDWAAAHTLLLPLHTRLEGADVNQIFHALREFGKTL